MSPNHRPDVEECDLVLFFSFWDGRSDETGDRPENRESTWIQPPCFEALKFRDNPVSLAKESDQCTRDSNA
ncbi:hypothetical protein Hypma_008596 [Hypsizygus marmoreus]|uniref:Uncharacterized protein n=1 Tax=Hypsizygus marmoreus TaxID=39966 RepID=A0A369JX54_HYPMA|nr:hypothetical protein Hypma_008596 [Hypsizygus marmoreus]